MNNCKTTNYHFSVDVLSAHVTTLLSSACSQRTCQRIAQQMHIPILAPCLLIHCIIRTSLRNEACSLRHGAQAPVQTLSSPNA